MTATDHQTGDYYATLGVPPEAGKAAIRAAYRDLMRRYHPDVNASVDAERRAKAINEAFACLRDERRRANYDERRFEPAADPIRAGPRAQSQPRYRPSPAEWARSATSQRTAALMMQPSWWKFALLGAAIVITIITFSMTSATPPAGPVVVDRA